MSDVTTKSAAFGGTAFDWALYRAQAVAVKCSKAARSVSEAKRARVAAATDSVMALLLSRACCDLTNYQ